MRHKQLAFAIQLLVFVMLSTAATQGASGAQSDKAGPPVRVIEVTGTAEVRALPDIARLSLEIESRAATATRCSAENAALTQKVIETLKQKLGGNGIVSTAGYSLEPEYQEPAPGQAAFRRPQIIGYVARNSVDVETGEMKLLGTLIDSAVAAGANRISSISFGLRDDGPTRLRALTGAAKDAQAQATALAGSLGVKLKQLMKASPAVPQPIPMQARMMSFAPSAANVPTPVEPGQLKLNATVFLTYEIE